MGQPCVSVIMPIYNAGRYLRESLDSVCAQTLEEIEIICVNDGSTDDSLDILNEYAAVDPRIIILDGPNRGYGHAMNRGMDTATGEFIGIVEPDDFIESSMYEDLCQLAKTNELDFVKADFFQFRQDESGAVLSEVCHLDNSCYWYGAVFNPSEHPEALLMTMNTWTGIYRRTFIRKHEIRYQETPGASYQDNGFWFQTFAFGERAMVARKPYYHYRLDNPNSSINDKGKAYCMAEEYNYIENLLREHDDVWVRFAPWYWAIRFNNYMFTLGRIDNALVPDYMRHFKETFNRALCEGYLEQELYTPVKWKKLTFILRHPLIFGCLSVANRPLRRHRNRRADRSLIEESVEEVRD